MSRPLPLSPSFSFSRLEYVFGFASIVRRYQNVGLGAIGTAFALLMIVSPSFAQTDMLNYPLLPVRYSGTSSTDTSGGTDTSSILTQGENLRNLVSFFLPPHTPFSNTAILKTAASSIPSVSTLAGGGSGTNMIVSSNGTGGTPGFNGININNFVGANVFYAAGYTGSTSIITNIEGGVIWNGADSLAHVNTVLTSPDPKNIGTSLGEYDRHATWVGSVLGARPTNPANEYQRGIAYGATLWSGAIATSFGSPPYSLSFNWSNGHAFTYPYETAMLTGVNGQTADVINSSWGSLSDKGGANVFATAVSGMARQGAKTVVFCAGNDGSATNTIWSPGSGDNTIVVGALGSDTDTKPYQTVSTFSSRGPQDYQGPDGFVAGVRARVDIVAPGQNLTLAYYGGATGGNKGGTTENFVSNYWLFNLAGTSFAAPIVAGGASLLADMAHQRGYAHGTDGEVIKAVLLNSADKIPGWTNNTTVVNGVKTTTQALDYNSGAGALNLAKAFTQFGGGDHGFSLSTAPITNKTFGIQKTGWDWETLAQRGTLNYKFVDTLASQSLLTATLNYYVGDTYSGTDSSGNILASKDYFNNLALELFYDGVDGAATPVLVGQSTAQYINTQHIYQKLDNQGTYELRVHWVSERYGDPMTDIAQTFGLAWSEDSVNVAATPESTTWILFVLGGMVFVGAIARKNIGGNGSLHGFLFLLGRRR